MRDFVLLYINGRRYEIRGAGVWSSLSDYLRRDLGLCDGLEARRLYAATVQEVIRPGLQARGFA